MRSNKLGFSTDTGPCCTTHYPKVTFCMTEFSSSKIIFHQFHNDNNEVEPGIGGYIIIDRNPMVQLGLLVGGLTSSTSMGWPYGTNEITQSCARSNISN